MARDYVREVIRGITDLRAEVMEGARTAPMDDEGRAKIVTAGYVVGMLDDQLARLTMLAGKTRDEVQDLMARIEDEVMRQRRES